MWNVRVRDGQNTLLRTLPDWYGAWIQDRLPVITSWLRELHMYTADRHDGCVLMDLIILFRSIPRVHPGWEPFSLDPSI